MKLVIFGSREIEDMRTLENALEACGMTSQVTEIVSGGARGVDRLGERYARQHGLPCTVFPAEWDKYGKSAGADQKRGNGEICRLWRSCVGRREQGNSAHAETDGGPRFCGDLSLNAKFILYFNISVHIQRVASLNDMACNFSNIGEALRCQNRLGII
jgi:hypothetical protein